MNFKFILIILSSSILTLTFTYTYAFQLPLAIATDYHYHQYVHQPFQHQHQHHLRNVTTTATTAESLVHTVPRQRAASGLGSNPYTTRRDRPVEHHHERDLPATSRQGISALNAGTNRSPPTSSSPSSSSSPSASPTSTPSPLPLTPSPSTSISSAPTPITNPKRPLLLSKLPTGGGKQKSSPSSPSPHPTRKKKVKPSPVPGGNQRDEEERVIFDKQCPTANCTARLSDCMECLDGISLTRCRRFTRLVFGVSGPEYEAANTSNNNNKTDAELLLKQKQLRALAKLLKRATPKSDSAYCAGFISTYATIRKLDIGDKATVNSIGVGNILRDELLRRFGEIVNVSSTVVYVVRNVTYDESDGGQERGDNKTYSNNNTTNINNSKNKNNDGSGGSTTTSRFTSHVGDETTDATSSFEMDMVKEMSRRLQGQLRLPTAAKQVLHANGTLRVWKIRQILKTLPSRDNWSTVFTKSPDAFTVRKRKGKVFLVFIGFNETFQAEH